MDERFYNDVLIVINVEKENYHPTKKTLLVRVAEERIFYVASAVLPCCHSTLRCETGPLPLSPRVFWVTIVVR